MNNSLVTDPRFWDRIAPKYAAKPVRDEAAYDATLERVRAHLAPEHRAAEFGCGTGTTALRLAPFAGEIMATDISGAMIAIAREKAQAQGVENVQFTAGTLDEEGLAPASFDVVMAFNLLHLIANLSSAIDRIHKLVKPGGLFISKTPCIGDQGLLLRLIVPMMRAVGKAPYVNFVKKVGLRLAIEAAGFDIVETGLYPAKSDSLFVVARKAE